MSFHSPIVTRWGDLPIVPDTESGIAAIEREQITKPRPMDLDGPVLYQPSAVDYPSSYELPNEEVFSDKLVINSIRLVQHAKKLRATLQAVQQQQETQKSGETDPPTNYPPLPPMPIGLEDILDPHTEKKCGDIAFKNEKEEKKFKPPPQLDEHCAQLVLKKSVAIVCAHVGFEITTESVLNTLVDILHEFYLKVTRALRAAVDNQHLKDREPFPDMLEQVFHEIGLGSVRKLQSFYKERIVNYHNHVLKHCQNLIAEYEKLTHPIDQQQQNQQQEEAKIVKIKEENLPQIHFPESEELEEMMVDHGENVIQLEELQTLQNIEHEPSTTMADDEGTKWMASQSSKSDHGMPTETPTLDSDDEIIKVNDSPNDASDIHVELIQPATSLSVTDIISPSSLGSNKKLKKK